MSVRLRRRGLALLVFVVCWSSAVAAEVPSPTVEGPIGSPAGAFLQSTRFDLAQVGYMQEEYFLSGTATAYTNVGPLGTDGLWTVAPAATAPYKTRIVVRRPIDRRKFNGTVVVEWFNVSAGLDAATDWLMIHTELVRSGFAWVGVSAQFVGVEGGPGLVNVISLPLKLADPARYGTLSHPGDSFSYDMFSQVAQAIRQPTGRSLLGDGLKLKKVIAIGESQSAFALVTYIDAIHPLTHLYDGYLLHSRGAIGWALSQPPQPYIPVPDTAAVRSDIDVPVLALETETDLTFLGYFAARQADARNFRLWEVAGAAHADSYTLVSGATDLGDSPAIVGLVVTAVAVPGILECGTPFNSGPHHFVANAALAALNRWVRRGKAPRSAPRLKVTAGPPVAIVLDANGNGMGGIRTPQVDVPLATFGDQQEGSTLCRLFGSTTPFDAAKLAALYPTHRAFVAAYRKAVRRSARAGWILPADAKLMKRWAAGAAVGG